MEQRDEIIKKFSRKFGVNADQALRMMVMPDPNLPPEKQMEMLTGGKLVAGAGPANTEPVAALQPVK